MTSLRATSTSPRRNKLLTIIFALLFSAQVLWAGSYRIGLCGDASQYLNLVEGALNTIGAVYAPLEMEKAQTRLKLAEETKVLKEKGKALQNEDFSSQNKMVSTDEAIVDSLPLELVAVSLSPSEEAFLKEGDPDAVAWLKGREALDAIVHVSSTTEDNITYAVLSLDGKSLRECWYAPALRESETDAVLHLFASILLDDDHHLQRIKVEPTSAAILDNGESLESNGQVVMADGHHLFSLSAYGYEDLTLAMEVKGEGTLSFSLQKAEPYTLYVNARPWDSSLKINGKSVEGKTVEGIFTPFSLSMEHEGFSLLSFQSKVDRSSVSLDLKPLWTEEVDLLKEKKGAFYASLFETLMSYGGYVAASAANGFSTYDVEPLVVVLGGVSIVSLVNLVQCAAEYYNVAVLGL